MHVCAFWELPSTRLSGLGDYPRELQLRKPLLGNDRMDIAHGEKEAPRCPEASCEALQRFSV
jgi:hypothetical protein